LFYSVMNKYIYFLFSIMKVYYYQGLRP
jgi:hypothetical protein